MRAAAIVVLALLGTAGCWADDISGPNRSTIRKAPWGSIFYDPVATGPHQLEVAVEEVRIKSRAGEVKITGSDINGYRLSAGGDVLTIRSSNSDLEIRWKEKVWTWRTSSAGCTLECNAPKDRIQFERSANTFTIKGASGWVSVGTNPSTVTIKSSAGNATITNYLGSRTYSGLSLDQIPYLGRGVFISFHGVGILIDVTIRFPMAEVSEWNEWKPVIGQPFEQNPR
ncbi:MAG TPA: hypothetical protein VJ505_04720 [Holophagaceae bacterium]|nr:hypothetical protein [Holophagaceae bacterium]